MRIIIEGSVISSTLLSNSERETDQRKLKYWNATLPTKILLILRRQAGGELQRRVKPLRHFTDIYWSHCTLG